MKLIRTKSMIAFIRAKSNKKPTYKEYSKDELAQRNAKSGEAVKKVWESEKRRNAFVLKCKTKLLNRKKAIRKLTNDTVLAIYSNKGKKYL